jgi:hypothetical protein
MMDMDDGGRRSGAEAVEPRNHVDSDGYGMLEEFETGYGKRSRYLAFWLSGVV